MKYKVFYDEIDGVLLEEYWKLNENNEYDFFALYVDEEEHHHFCLDYNCKDPGHWEPDRDVYRFENNLPGRN